MDNKAVLPTITRARGYRVYDGNGRRYLDFYQDNGNAITGHRPNRAILEIKGILSRGLIAAYPSVYMAQAVKAIKSLIPEAIEVRIYRSRERALQAAERHSGHPFSADSIADPAVHDSPSGDIALWRPFIDSKAVDAPVLLPVLPITSPPAACALVFREPPNDGVPTSDPCSPVSLAAVKRSVYDLIAYIRECDRSKWKKFDRYTLWKRRGPYLVLRDTQVDFPALFEELLAGGILIAPQVSTPSIIPDDYSSGELGYLDRTYAIT